MTFSLSCLMNHHHLDYFCNILCPTELAVPEQKDMFYDQLFSTISKVMNAQVQSNNRNMGRIIGKHGLGQRNDLIGLHGYF